MKMKAHSLLALLAVVCTACGTNEHERAVRYLDLATAAYDSGQLNRAKLYVDSLDEQCPRAVEVRRDGLALRRHIREAENRRLWQFADSVITVATASIDSLLPSFTVIDPVDDEGVRYIYKGMEPERNDRNYLYVSVGVTGAAQLIATYRGASALEMTAVRVHGGDGTSCRTVEQPYDDGFCYRYTVNGTRRETVVFTDSTAAGVPAYIALHADDKLRADFLGRRTQSVAITARDAAAIATSLRLAVLLRTREDFRRQRDIAAHILDANRDKAQGENP